MVHLDMEFQQRLSQQIETLKAELAADREKKETLDLNIARKERRLFLMLELTDPDMDTYQGESPIGLGKLSRVQTADEVYNLIKKEGKSLHYREIYSRLLAMGIEPPVSEDPASAILARFYNDPRLNRYGKGLYGLAAWRGNVLGLGSQKDSEPAVEYGKTKPKSFQLLGKSYPVTHWKDILVQVCGILYESFPADFRGITNVKSSKGNPYFSPDSQALNRAVEIENSGIFVEVNLNPDQLIKRCKAVILAIGLSEEEFSVETP